ncbi:MAG: hypothetical protein IH931_01250 [candidate division Zixibacteria bacterium]|nr:hypothetical protein [candidate division Zixibacteria bacterium]
MRNSAIKSIFRIDYKALLPALILSAFLLICFTSENSSEPVCSAEAYEQLELKSLTDANSGDEGSRGMATNPVSKTETTAWILAASLTTSTSNQSSRGSWRTSGFSNISAHKDRKSRCRDKNTLSMVDSDLGRQFTLLGEKPSGTS